MALARLVAAGLAAALLLAAPSRAQEGEGDVVYVPTPQHVVEEMLAMAKVGPSASVVASICASAASASDSTSRLKKPQRSASSPPSVRPK